MYIAKIPNDDIVEEITRQIWLEARGAPRVAAARNRLAKVGRGRVRITRCAFALLSELEETVDGVVVPQRGGYMMWIDGRAYPLELEGA